MIVFGKDQDLRVSTGESDRERFVVGEVSVDAIPGAVDSDFDGAVQVYKFCVGECFAPDIELSGGKDFAGEKDATETGEGKLVKESKICDRHHHGWHPEEK